MLDVARLRVLAAVARTGSVTAAARELHYSQPSVSHHLAKLEAETGAKLIQQAGRGIRLTEAGQMLAERATEIIGRIDSAASELSAHVGLRAGRVRLAAFPSALGTFVPGAAALLAREHPGLELRLTETEPPEALRMLRAGYVDVAVIFRYDDTAPGGRRHPPDPPAGRPQLPGHRRKDRRPVLPPELPVDRGLRPVPEPPARPLRRRGLRTGDRLHHRRQHRRPGPGRRRDGGDGPARPRPAGAPPPEGQRDRDARLDPAHLAATYGEPPDPPATAALLATLATSARSEQPPRQSP